MKCHPLHPLPRPGEVLLSLPLLIQALGRSLGPPVYPTHFWMLLEPLNGCEVAASLRRDGTNTAILPESKQHLGLPSAPNPPGKHHTRFPTKPS